VTKEIGFEVEVGVENLDLEEGVIQVDLETDADARAEAGPGPVG
jgi:hypothetical protein